MQTRQDKIDKFIDEVLEEQFRTIGLKYKPAIVKRDGWYSEHTWSVEQREKFHVWFMGAYKKRFSFTTKEAENAWLWWNLFAGWREETD